MTRLALYSSGHESINTEISLHHHKMFSDIQFFFFIFFLRSRTTLNVPASHWSSGFPGARVILRVIWCSPLCQQLPYLTLTLPLPSLCSGYDWPSQTDLCLPVFLSCFTVFTCPLPKTLHSFLFDHLNIRVSFISFPTVFQERCAFHDVTDYTFSIICQEWWIKFPLQFLPYQDIVLTLNLLIFPLKRAPKYHLIIIIIRLQNTQG